MTSTTGTAQHPDVSEISDLAEGLLAPSRQAQVKEHLDGCALCADVRASLDEIRGLLGTLPGPHRMPADIAGRIDAALAAEALLSATSPDGEPADVSRETAAPSTQETAGVRDTSASAGRPAGRPRAAAGPGRNPRRRRRTAILGAAFGVAAVGMSVLLLQSVHTADDTGPRKAEQEASAAKEGPTYSEDNLQGRVHTLLAANSGQNVPADTTQKVPRSGDEPPVSAWSSPNSPKKAVDVPPCIQQGIGRSEAPLAAEQGTYEGTQAYLVVLPSAGDPSRVQVYVVNAACVGTAPSGKAEILVTHTYPRR